MERIYYRPGKVKPKLPMLHGIKSQKTFAGLFSVNSLIHSVGAEVEPAWAVKSEGFEVPRGRAFLWEPR